MEMRIVVATDGSDAALGALHLAQSLAARHGAAVEVTTVWEPLPMSGVVASGAFAYTPGELDATGPRALERRVREQLVAAGPEIAAWPLTVELGAPAPTIVRVAQARGASLLVLGLGRHALADRLLGSETALRVTRLAHIPVLAVPAEVRNLPNSALVAVDFTEFSRDAAETAVRLVRPGGTLHLAHVLWRPGDEVPWVGGVDWIEEHRDRLHVQLESFAAALAGAADVDVRPQLLEGDAAHAVLRLADSVQAELIAAGSHGTGFFGRILMGSVSTRLLRGATCAVLITPPRALPEELERHWAQQARTATAAADAAAPAAVPSSAA